MMMMTMMAFQDSNKIPDEIRDEMIGLMGGGFGGCLIVLVGFLALCGGLVWAGRNAKATKRIICPNQNCGYQGAPERSINMTTGLLLCLLCIIPGVLYFVWNIAAGGSKLSCPKCGVDIKS